MAHSLPFVPLLESTCTCPALGALQPAGFSQAKQCSEPYTEKARLKRLCGADRGTDLHLFMQVGGCALEENFPQKD